MIKTTYTVTADPNLKINLAPQSVVEEVRQNLAILLSTPKSSVPLDRGLGFWGRYADKPPHVAKTLIISELYDVVSLYESRAEIVNIAFGHDNAAGKLSVRLEVKINGG